MESQTYSGITRAGTKHLDQARKVPGLGEPIVVSTMRPVGEVLLVDGARAEGPGEGFADGRQGLQPAEDGLAVGSVGETGVELRAEIPVQPGDFIDARHNEVAFPFHGLL